MPRPRSPYWHDTHNAWKTRIDGKEVILRHRDRTKVAHGDQRGVREAVERLLAEHDASVRRMADPTVEDVCREYLIAAARECVRDTMIGKEWTLRQWCDFGTPRYGDLPARRVDSTHLHRIGKAWRRAGHAGDTIHRLYREVKACWAWAARPEPERTPIRILEADPIAGLRMPAGSPRASKYLPLSVARQLIEVAAARASEMTPLRRQFDEQAVLMLRLIAETGCRPKEACRARWDDLDEAQGLLVLTEHKTARKTGKPRVIVIPEAILAELIAHRRSGHAHPAYLFAHARGRGEASHGAGRETGAPWERNGYGHWFSKIVRRARKEGMTLPEGLTLYWLRHSYLTDAQLAVGGERAADLAGNTAEIARDRYLHVQADELRRQQEEVAKRRG